MRSFHVLLLALVAMLGLARTAQAADCSALTTEAVGRACGGAKLRALEPSDAPSTGSCDRMFFSGQGAELRSVTVQVLDGAPQMPTVDPSWRDVRPVSGLGDEARRYEHDLAPGETVLVIDARKGAQHVAVFGPAARGACTEAQLVDVARLAFGSAPAAAATSGAPGATAPGTPAPAAVPGTPDDRSASFHPVEGGEVRSGEQLLVTAYAVLWVILMAYLGLVWRTQASLSQRVDLLEQTLDKAVEAQAKAEAPKKKKGD
jgi:hypothetical protein